MYFDHACMSYCVSGIRVIAGLFHRCVHVRHFNQGIKVIQIIVVLFIFYQNHSIIGQIYIKSSITEEGFDLMKKHYKKFYRNSNFNYEGDVADIDEIMDTYLMPIQELQKNQYYSTYWQTRNKTTLSDSSVLIQQQQQNLNMEGRTFPTFEPTQDQQKSKAKDTNEQIQIIGSSCQTLNLNNYFHQQISNFLKKLQAFKYLDENQNKICQNYYLLSKTFSSHLQLCNSQKIKKFCLDYLTSSQFITRLLLSSKMNFQRKKNVLKYTNKICQSLSSNTRIKNWRN